MSNPNELSASQAAELMATGDLTSETLVQACLTRIVEREPQVQAWTYLDPEYALAHAGLAWALWIDLVDYVIRDKYQLEEAFSLADRSLALKENWLGYVVQSKRYLVPDAWGISYKPTDHDAAVAALRRAVAIAPGNPNALAELAQVLAFAGELGEAAELIRRAKRLNPAFPRWYYHRIDGIISYLDGRYADAELVATAWRASETLPEESEWWLAAAKAQRGHEVEARSMLEDQFTRRDQTKYLQYFEGLYPFKRDEDRTRFIDGLRKAGAPDANE